MRRDPFERFVSCLIYVPRERYNTELRQRFGAILEAAFNGTVDELRARARHRIRPRARAFHRRDHAGAIPDARVEEIELKLVEAARSWADKLKAALVEAKGEERGLRLLRRYAAAFPTDYRERFGAPRPSSTSSKIESVLAGDGVGMHLYRPLEMLESVVRFKIYRDARGRRPLRHPADARGHGPEGHRRSPLRHRAARGRPRLISMISA